MRLVDITKNKVKNLKGTSHKICNCKSWKEHWEKYSGVKAKLCAVVGCRYSADIGAHVMQCDSSDKNHYIVPMCHGHNKAEDECLVVDKELISANINDTCGI